MSNHFLFLFLSLPSTYLFILYIFSISDEIEDIVLLLLLFLIPPTMLDGSVGKQNELLNHPFLFLRIVLKILFR